MAHDAREIPKMLFVLSRVFRRHTSQVSGDREGVRSVDARVNKLNKRHVTAVRLLIWAMPITSAPRHTHMPCCFIMSRCNYSMQALASIHHCHRGWFMNLHWLGQFCLKCRVSEGLRCLYWAKTMVVESRSQTKKRLYSWSSHLNGYGLVIKYLIYKRWLAWVIFFNV